MFWSERRLELATHDHHQRNDRDDRRRYAWRAERVVKGARSAWL